MNPFSRSGDRKGSNWGLRLSGETRTDLMDLAEGMAAVMALRKSQRLAVDVGLDKLTMEEIDAEIREARQALKRRKQSA